MADYQPIRDLLDAVRARLRRLLVFQSTIRAGLAVAGVLAIAVVLAAIAIGIGSSVYVLVSVAGIAVALIGAAIVWGFWPARQTLSDRRIARLIEENDASLDDRLVSAVDVAARDVSPAAAPPAFAGPLVADAARRASAVDPASVLPSDRLRRTGLQAAAAVLLAAVVAFLGRGPARQAVDTVALTLFPSQVSLEVTPGNVRLKAGSSLTIEARLVGNTAPVVAEVRRAAAGTEEESEWQAAEMASDSSGRFTLALESIDTPFKYQVVAGAVKSEIYEVHVARPPRVARIDAEYTYPAALRMPPRVETDAGDIYAPSGTDVRLRVHTAGEVAEGRMTLADGQVIALTRQSPSELVASLKIVRNDSYRVALADAEGLASAGDTEYFIRMLEDRPPDVHVLKPARDRAVTPLEEVEIEAEAEDDYGVQRLELVYAIRGGSEAVVPFDVPRPETTVSGSRTLYLEDLGVRPGDFVSYYVRARDVARGKRPSEARSDIFFLEVRPFEQEFALAQSQAAGAGGGSNRSIDDLVAAQKEIIVATWKLDRRTQAASGARSEQDIKAVARAEAELKTRVEQTSSSFRESTMRDPRRGQAQPGRGGQPPRPSGPEPLRAGQTLPEEDAMTAAAMAMGEAVDSLERLKTAPALPAEMEALNHLLRAQADVKRREVMRQQAGGGGGQNRASQDLSSLFDRELQKQQQTNYETPTSTEQREDGNDGALDRIKELAARQDELLRRQQQLEKQRDQMSPEELKRALENLTREQSELRERAEQLAREVGNRRQQQGGQRQQGAGQQSQSAGQQSQSAGQQSQGAGQPSQSAGGRSPGAGQRTPGADGQSRGAGEEPQDPGDRLRRAAEAMGNAASELRRQNPGQASASGGQALQQLQEAQRQLQSEAPDERRRAMGDMQLEARQLADAQRQVAAERAKAGTGEPGADALRRLAGEQERLADRLRRLQNGLSQQANTPGSGERGSREDRAAAENARNAAREASRDIDRQKLADRMQQSADRMRAGSGRGDGLSADARGRASSPEPRPSELTREQEEIARALDRLADRISAATDARDEESRKLTDQLARTRELRDRIDRLTREMESMAEEGQAGQRGQPGQQAGRGAGQGQADAGSGAAERARLRDDFARELKEARALLESLQRENPSLGQGGGMGFTFEGQGMVTSAPGTEAFKQDFTRWEQLRQQVTLALEQAESEISRKLQAKESRDRLAAGLDDRAPAAYEQQVDSYFKALADKKPKP